MQSALSKGQVMDMSNLQKLVFSDTKTFMSNDLSHLSTLGLAAQTQRIQSFCSYLSHDQRSNRQVPVVGLFQLN